jgi:hypothetical protein
MDKPIIARHEIDDPLVWLESLTADELMKWLRQAIWLQEPEPIVVPVTTSFTPHLSALFQQGSPNLKIKLREVIPELLREWGKYEPPKALDDLLIFCGTLSCVLAEPTIVLIATERLKDQNNYTLSPSQPDEIVLRQRCLAVLSGLGCTAGTIHVFKRYFEDLDYTAYCYRALYRYDLRYAAAKLPALLRIHREAGAIKRLKLVLRLLFVHTLAAEQREEVWREFLALSLAGDLPSMLADLKANDIYILPPGGELDGTDRFNVIYGQPDQPSVLEDFIDATGLDEKVMNEIMRSYEKFVPDYESHYFMTATG